MGALALAALVSCSDEEDILPQQQEKIVSYLTRSHTPTLLSEQDVVRNASSSGFLPEEREWMSRFLDSGFIDTFRLFNHEPNQYTWWSFRANARANNKGWRIDYAMASEAARPLLKNAWLLPDVRHSDHCPAVLEITI